MKNLAGDPCCDEVIHIELRRARVPEVPIEKSPSDVPATIGGQLGGFKFRRFWYYWSVSGDVPIAVARDLYADPVGVRDIRAAGHCGCPPPDEWATHYAASGRKIIESRQREDCLRQLESGSELLREVAQEVLDKHDFADDPAAAAARSVVGLYHIDTEVGLRVFVDTLVARGVVSR